MCFMHLYLKYTQPLFIQSIMPLKSLYESQVSTFIYVTYSLTIPVPKLSSQEVLAQKYEISTNILS